MYIPFSKSTVKSKNDSYIPEIKVSERLYVGFLCTLIFPCDTRKIRFISATVEPHHHHSVTDRKHQRQRLILVGLSVWIIVNYLDPVSLMYTNLSHGSPRLRYSGIRKSLINLVENYFYNGVAVTLLTELLSLIFFFCIFSFSLPVCLKIKSQNLIKTIYCWVMLTE